MDDNRKIVDFGYCASCIHRPKTFEEDPCLDCICNTMNEGTRKPVHYEENKK